MIRRPAVAGQFYPGTEISLSREIERLVNSSVKKEDVKGAVSPHAGYIYSGSVAGSVLATITPKPVYVIIGPNHTGLGAPFSLSASDSWQTPLGEVKIDRELSARIKKDSRYIKEDELAHSHEHSIEVQLPFLQLLQKDFRLVPMIVSYASLDVYRDIGKSIVSAIKGLNLERDVTIIASSDMTHYETQGSAKEKDSKAIEAMLELDEEKLIERVEELDISMCGYAPAAIMITAVKALGAKKARLVKYLTSGDASGDYSSVVGYAGIIIT